MTLTCFGFSQLAYCSERPLPSTWRNVYGEADTPSYAPSYQLMPVPSTHLVTAKRLMKRWQLMINRQTFSTLERSPCPPSSSAQCAVVMCECDVCPCICWSVLCEDRGLEPRAPSSFDVPLSTGTTPRCVAFALAADDYRLSRDLSFAAQLCRPVAFLQPRVELAVLLGRCIGSVAQLRDGVCGHVLDLCARVAVLPGGRRIRQL